MASAIRPVTLHHLAPILKEINYSLVYSDISIAYMEIQIYIVDFLSTSLLGASRSYFFPPFFSLTLHEISLYFTLITQNLSLFPFRKFRN